LAAHGRSVTLAAIMMASDAEIDGVAELGLEVVAQLAGEPRLELAHALAGDAELVAQLLQGEGIFRDHALVEDLELLAAEPGAKALEVLVEQALELAARDPIVGAAIVARHELHPRHAAAFAVAEGRIERGLAR